MALAITSVFIEIFNGVLTLSILPKIKRISLTYSIGVSQPTTSALGLIASECVNESFRGKSQFSTAL